MKILILGSGLMGPAAAYNAMSDPAVERVTVADLDPARLEECTRLLRPMPGGEKLDTIELDLAGIDAVVDVMRGFDVILAALPWSASMFAFRAALRAGVPIVDLAIPDDDEMAALKIEAADGLIVIGCGLEPGLTEIEARRLAARLDRVEDLHIHCGGVPEHPSGPLGYKIVFGGRQLPLREIPALAIVNGVATRVQRYSGVERIAFEGVGECESWHEGMMPWLLDLPEFGSLRSGSQKTIRWPGYASKATALLELGLLSQKPVLVDGCEVRPKALVDMVLYPHVRLGEDEGDVTLFRVDVAGWKGDEFCTFRTDMVDRRDRSLGFTSMARTTAFTGAIIARMIARGDIRGTGLLTADQAVTGSLIESLHAELATAGIHFMTSELAAAAD